MAEQLNRTTQTGKAYLEGPEILRLIAAADNPRDRLLATLLYRLGCRISEVLAIGVEDFSAANATVTIRHLKSRIKLKCPKCQAKLGLSSCYCPACGEKVAAVIQESRDFRKMRVLPIDPGLVVILNEYVASGAPISKHGKLLLFAINRHRAWQIIKTLGEKAGLPRLINTETGKIHNVSPHKLRDAFAVRAVKHNDTGDGLRMLQEHLGHQSFNTTARYRKVAGEEHRRWYDDLWKTEGPSIK